MEGDAGPGAGRLRGLHPLRPLRLLPQREAATTSGGLRRRRRGHQQAHANRHRELKELEPLALQMLFAMMPGFHLHVFLLLSKALLVCLSVCLALYLSDLRETAVVHNMAHRISHGMNVVVVSIQSHNSKKNSCSLIGCSQQHSFRGISCGLCT